MERTRIVRAVVSEEQELLGCGNAVPVWLKFSHQDRGSFTSRGHNAPLGLPSLRTAFKLLARRESQSAMVTKIRNQALRSRIQLLATRRQFVAIIAKSVFQNTLFLAFR